MEDLEVGSTVRVVKLPNKYRTLLGMLEEPRFNNRGHRGRSKHRAGISRQVAAYRRSKGKTYVIEAIENRGGWTYYIVTENEIPLGFTSSCLVVI